MKIAPYKAESFINNIANNKEIFGVLIYGPESGLVKINSDKVVNLIVPDSSDPFLVSNINPKSIGEDGAIINDEFVSIPMLGGRKLIRIDGGGNKITNHLKSIFKNDSKPVGTNFILINAGSLDAASSLRKFAESSPYFAAIACYEDNENTIRNIIKEKFRSYNLKPENEDVINIIINKFGKNRLIILNEIEKLSVYMGDQEIVTSDIIQNVVADISQISLDEFINSFLSLEIDKSDHFIQKLFHENVNPITIIRSLSNYLIKLYTVKHKILAGGNLEAEMKSQRIFFKQEHSFKKHLKFWNITHIEALISKLQDLELKCKTKNTNAENMLFAFNNFCFVKYRKFLKY